MSAAILPLLLLYSSLARAHSPRQPCLPTTTTLTILNEFGADYHMHVWVCECVCVCIERVITDAVAAAVARGPMTGFAVVVANGYGVYD